MHIYIYICIYLYISIIQLSCLSVCVSLTMCLCIKMLIWVLFMMVKDEKKTCLWLCPWLCPKLWHFCKNQWFSMIYNKKIKWLGHFIFEVKLSRRKRNHCVEINLSRFDQVYIHHTYMPNYCLEMSLLWHGLTTAKLRNPWTQNFDTK